MVDPIRLPGSPFWNVFKRFGRDEMIALLLNVAGTTIASFFTVSAVLLAFIGPVIEKIGFFPAHIYGAVSLYRALPSGQRKGLSTYFWRAVKGGSVSLVEDILLHDPIYVLLFLGLSIYPGIPVWLVVSFSFLVAVVAVSCIEVGVTEIRYALFRRRMLKAGFGVDSYFEARFYIESGNYALPLIERLQAGLGMKFGEDREYYDTYFENDLPNFAGRSPVVRLRHRTLGQCDRKRVEDLARIISADQMQTVQVVYIRSSEAQERALDQFRFFLNRKEKFYYLINDDMPDLVSEIKNEAVRQILRAGRPQKKVSFRRSVLLDETKLLLATVDTSLENGEGCIVEFKVRTNTELLLRAMRFLMMEFPVTQTTRTKAELALFG